MRFQSAVHVSAVALAVSLGMAAAPALAQTAAVAEPDAPGEIVVTAAKRSENLQSVPISVSAITGDTLSKSRTTSVDDLTSCGGGGG